MTNISFNILYKAVSDINERTVYYVIENDRSNTMDAFSDLKPNQQKALKDTIKNMACYERKYKNPSIKPLKGFQNLYQIRVGQNRFYYFTLIEKYIILFDHLLKKSNHLSHEIYVSINKKRAKYETEFRRQKQI